MAKPELIHWTNGQKGEKGYYEGYSIRIKRDNPDEKSILLSLSRCEVVLKNIKHIKAFVKGYGKSK